MLSAVMSVFMGWDKEYWEDYRCVLKDPHINVHTKHEVKESLVWKTAPYVGMVGRMYIPETEEVRHP